MSAPVAPPGGWDFAVPPNWPAPPGFDPRKGHQVDPTWPPAPVGWQFWVPAGSAPRPAAPAYAAPTGPAYLATHAATYAAPSTTTGYRLPWTRILIGGAVALFFVGRLLLGLLGHSTAGSSSGVADGVGSCWALKSGITYVAVSCSSSTAQYQVVATVATPSACPQTSDSYLDSEELGSPTRYECLVPVR